MKKVICFPYLFFLLAQSITAQTTNTFPSTGNTGIGTTSPVNKLDVFGGIGVGFNTPISLTSTGYVNLKLGLLGGTPSNVTDAFVGVHTTGGPGGISGDLLLIPRSDVSASILMFSGTTMPAERMRVNYDGNIGINTASPQAKLHVHDGTDINAWFRNGTSGLGFQIISIKDDNSTFQNLSADGAKLLLNTQTNGNVGIGTTNPKSQLHISNSTTAAGTLRVGGDTSGLFGVLTEYSQSGATTGSIYSSSGYSNSSALFKLGVVGNTNQVVMKGDGNVGIGTASPSEKLSVDGNITANGFIYTKKITVTATPPWPDYVFNKDYKLRSLSSLESFITKNKHLPEIPSEKEVQEKGISVGDNQALLLKKIEELTLYVIKMNKANDQMKAEIKMQAKEINQLKNKK